MISTGLKKLDGFLSGGIPEGVIVDIFGGSGTGKTQLLLQILINCVENGGSVLYFDTTGGFRPERILEIQNMGASNSHYLNQITISRIRNTSEQIKSLGDIGDGFSLVAIDNITDLFSYEYRRDESTFEKNSLFIKYMRELSKLAISKKIPVVVTNMIRGIDGREVENMRGAIDPFTHIKIHLFKKSSRFGGRVYWALGSADFSFAIEAAGLVNRVEDI